jgi:3,4-dihydroxy 2-butanone 4-phosphate synthase/GTP cyclohydrolase II
VSATGFSSIDRALEEFRLGRFVVVADDETRENEGDLIVAAEHISPDKINFMATHARGLICVSLTSERLDQLRLPLMVADNSAPLGTAFCVSVEARHGTTTGISAADRSNTIRALIDPRARPDDFVRPGHTFPLRARTGGVLERAGQTEAAVDLARLTGLYPAGVICEIMNADGTMARRPDLEEFARVHDLCLISVAQLAAYRQRTEQLVQRGATATLPTRFGTFRAIGYASLVDGTEQIALVMGAPEHVGDPLVRLHSECLTGDALHSLRCDCGQQLDGALEMIGRSGQGVLLYLRQEGRGIGLLNKLHAYQLQDAGLDTVEANRQLGFAPDLRDYAIGAQILRDLGLTRVRLLTNNPEKISALERYGVRVTERVPLHAPPVADSARYLEAKRTKLGHLIPAPDATD